MSQLLEKLKRSKQSDVIAGGVTFITRGLNDFDLQEMKDQDNFKTRELLRRCVVGWRDVKESDITPAGDPVPAAFETDLCLEWIAYDAEKWMPLQEKILSDFKARTEKLEAAPGELETGSKS